MLRISCEKKAVRLNEEKDSERKRSLVNFSKIGRETVHVSNLVRLEAM